MPYRAKSYREHCSVCETEATTRCSLCGKYTCADHAIEDACIDCATQEFLDDVRLETNWGKWALGSLVGVPLGVTLGLMFTSATVALVGFGVGYLGPLAAGAGMSVVRRRQHRRRRKLDGTAVRRQLPPAR